MDRRRGSAVVWLAAIGAAVFLLRLLIGSTGFGYPDDGVIRELRWLSAVSAACIGAALSVSGVLLQATLRNPLASPWVLGLTSGASLGVVLVIVVSGGGGTGWMTESFGAVAGAMVALLLVYGLAKRKGHLDPVALLLIGVMVSVCFGALTMLVQQFLPDRGFARFGRWMLGSISEDTSWGLLAGVALATLAGTYAGVVIGRPLDAAMLADDEARSVGVNPDRLRTVCFGLAGVLTAGTVLLAGPIGFVGLVCPHVARLLVGARHRMLVVASALIGACFVLCAEVVSVGVAWWSTSSAAVPATGRIPVGILTALIGAPAFIGMLISRSELRVQHSGGV